jgi:type I restriction enzyme S subunit
MAAYRHIGKISRDMVGAINVALIKFETRNEDVLRNDLIEVLIPSKYIKEELLKQSERAHIPSTSVELIKDLKIPLPKTEIQDKIISEFKKMKSVFNGIEKLQTEAEKAINQILADVWGIEIVEEIEEEIKEEVEQ